MGVFYKRLLRPLLFLQEPEKAHDYGVAFLAALGRLNRVCRIMESWNQVSSGRPIELFGLRFPNAVGLAAGMDKNARIWRVLPALGFGHVEVGTVTAQRQPGNPSPRIFRYPEFEALVNRMGFNNDGAEAVAKRLKLQQKQKRRSIPLGINIGKTKVVPLDKAVDDYLFSFQHLAPYADYITINVSSPNTPGLRELHAKEHLSELLGTLYTANRSRAKKLGQPPIPLLLKISPDLSFAQVDQVLEVMTDIGLDGIIATNTTVERSPRIASTIVESGGLSGRPLHARSAHVINYIYRATGGRLPIIGSGGIHDAASAGATMDAGASLVQVYTGFIYEGPFFPRDIAWALAPRHSGWL